MCLSDSDLNFQFLCNIFLVSTPFCNLEPYSLNITHCNTFVLVYLLHTLISIIIFYGKWVSIYHIQKCSFFRWSAKSVTKSLGTVQKHTSFHTSFPTMTNCDRKKNDSPQPTLFLSKLLLFHWLKRCVTDGWRFSKFLLTFPSGHVCFTQKHATGGRGQQKVRKLSPICHAEFQLGAVKVLAKHLKWVGGYLLRFDESA